MPESLRKQFDRPIPSYHDYAGAVAEVVSKAFPDREAPELVIEPGAAVVADVVDFVCRVAAVKRLDDRRVVLTTGSVQNIKARSSPVNQPLRVVAPSDRDASPDEPPADLTGYTCMEDDLLFAGHTGALEVGDFLILGNTGAYTTTFKPPFIRAAPPILSFHPSSGSFSLVRRGEELDDVLATFTC
jgi:diaminopimelate decarboxylase